MKVRRGFQDARELGPGQAGWDAWWVSPSTRPPEAVCCSRGADPRGGQAVVRCCEGGILGPPGELRGKSRALRRSRQALSKIGAEWGFFRSEQRPDPVPSAARRERLPDFSAAREEAVRRL